MEGGHRLLRESAVWPAAWLAATLGCQQKHCKGSAHYHDMSLQVFLALVVAVVHVSPASVGATWLSAELVFFLWYTAVRLPRLDRLGKVTDDCSSLLKSAEALFQRMLDEREGALQVQGEYPHHLGNWFIGQGGKPCGLSEVATLLDHLLLQGQARQLLCVHSQEVLHTMAASLLQKLGLDQHLASHDDSSPAKPLAAGSEPLMVCYRPLLFYMLMEGIAAGAHIALTAQQGFSCIASTTQATYYMKKGTSKHQPPIVLLHGIGVGLAPYVKFISQLQGTTGRTVIAVQYRHISMRMTHLMPSPTQLAADLEVFLCKQGFSKAAVVSHSYGTLVASALVKSSPGLVSQLTLVDPVCFAMFLPHLIRNALFFHVGSTEGTHHQAGAVASTGSRFSLRSLLRGVVVRDVHVAAALSRSTPWGDCNLFPTDLPAHTKVHVVLSASDHLVPVQEVVSMLKSTPAASQVQLQVFPGRGHGAFVMDPFMQDHIISMLKTTADPAWLSLVNRPATAEDMETELLCGCSSTGVPELQYSQADTVSRTPGVVGLLHGFAQQQRLRAPLTAKRGLLTATRSLSLAPVRGTPQARSVRSRTTTMAQLLSSWVMRAGQTAAVAVRVARGGASKHLAAPRAP